MDRLICDAISHLPLNLQNPNLFFQVVSTRHEQRSTMTVSFDIIVEHPPRAYLGAAPHTPYLISITTQSFKRWNGTKHAYVHYNESVFPTPSPNRKKCIDTIKSH